MDTLQDIEKASKIFANSFEALRPLCLLSRARKSKPKRK